MEIEAAKVEWIVKSALLDESASTEYLVEIMTQQGITSIHLLNYIEDDQYWPVYETEPGKRIEAKDEKYVLHLSNTANHRQSKLKREAAREAVYNRFHTGRKFNEWIV